QAQPGPILERFEQEDGFLQLRHVVVLFIIRLIVRQRAGKEYAPAALVLGDHAVFAAVEHAVARPGALLVAEHVMPVDGAALAVLLDGDAVAAAGEHAAVCGPIVAAEVDMVANGDPWLGLGYRF